MILSYALTCSQTLKQIILNQILQTMDSIMIRNMIKKCKISIYQQFTLHSLDFMVSYWLILVVYIWITERQGVQIISFITIPKESTWSIKSNISILALKVSVSVMLKGPLFYRLPTSETKYPSNSLPWIAWAKKELQGKKSVNSARLRERRPTGFK